MSSTGARRTSKLLKPSSAESSYAREPPQDLETERGEIHRLRGSLNWVEWPDAERIARRIRASYQAFPELAAEVVPSDFAEAVVQAGSAASDRDSRLFALHLATIVDPHGRFRLNLLAEGHEFLSHVSYMEMLNEWLSTKPSLAQINRLIRALRVCKHTTEVEEALGVLASTIQAAPSLATLMLGSDCSYKPQNEGASSGTSSVQRGVTLVRTRAVIDRLYDRNGLGPTALDSESMSVSYDTLRRLIDANRPVTQSSGRVPANTRRYVRWPQFCVDINYTVFRGIHFLTEYAKHDPSRGSLAADHHDGGVFGFGLNIVLPKGAYEGTFLGSAAGALDVEFSVECANIGRLGRLVALLTPRKGTVPLAKVPFAVSSDGAPIELKIWLPKQHGRLDLDFVVITRSRPRTDAPLETQPTQTSLLAKRSDLGRTASLPFVDATTRA